MSSDETTRFGVKKHQGIKCPTKRSSHITISYEHMKIYNAFHCFNSLPQRHNNKLFALSWTLYFVIWLIIYRSVVQSKYTLWERGWILMTPVRSLCINCVHIIEFTALIYYSVCRINYSIRIDIYMIIMGVIFQLLTMNHIWCNFYGTIFPDI